MTISASETVIARPRRIHVINDTPEILDVFRMLKRDGRKAMCLGRTADGWPKSSSRSAVSSR